MQLPDPPAARELARRLGDLGFSVSGIESHLGPAAAAALARDALVPVRRALHEDGSALATAIRLFLLAEAVPAGNVTSVVGEGPMGELLSHQNGSVRAVLEVAPYAVDEEDLLVAADWPKGRTGRPLDRGHVLGVGGASTLLAQCTVRPPVGAALDVGTGCGVQALHLSRHSQSVTATDLSLRCLTVADFTFAMNGLEVTSRRGDLLEPVSDETFDLIVSNPPFVIGSPSSERHDYRDSGLAGDDVCRRLAAGVSDRLNPGGWFQMLANWEITESDDWSRHPRSWLAQSPLDCWVVQRHVMDPAAYVQTWLADSGADGSHEADDVYGQWLDELERRGVVGIGFGLVSMRAGGLDSPLRCFQHVPQELVQPVGPDIERWFTAQDRLRGLPGADVLLAVWQVADDVEVIEERQPGAQDPLGRSVRRRTGFAWNGPIDDFGERLLARADGATPLADAVVAVAADSDVAAAEALAAAVPVVRQLVAEGFLVAPP